jgi:ribulose-phosphate 3-epimerase
LPHIIPSILAADFARLGDEIAALEQAGVSTIQIDVMDGHFVPNISVGVPVLYSLRQVTRLKLDVHLMVLQPERHLEAFAAAGADVLTVHQEASLHLHRQVLRIRELGCSPGVALNPGTAIDVLDDALLREVEVVLLMTVNPGFGGQRFIAGVLEKVRRMRRRLDGLGLSTPIQVDGGIDVSTARLVVEAGAEQLVAGSAVFSSGIPVKQAVARLQKAAVAALGT